MKQNTFPHNSLFLPWGNDLPSLGNYDTGVCLLKPTWQGPLTAGKTTTTVRTGLLLSLLPPSPPLFLLSVCDERNRRCNDSVIPRRWVALGEDGGRLPMSFVHASQEQTKVSALPIMSLVHANQGQTKVSSLPIIRCLVRELRRGRSQ